MLYRVYSLGQDLRYSLGQPDACSLRVRVLRKEATKALYRRIGSFRENSLAKKKTRNS
jgi:hypothetical protein